MTSKPSKMTDLSPSKTKSMALFELLEPQDINYSHFVEFFDNLPIFVDGSVKRYWKYSEAKTSITTEHTFKQNEISRDYIVTLKPGRVTHKINNVEYDVLVYPSIQREQAIYDALRKLACSGSGGFFDSDLGAFFTLTTLQSELKKFNKTYSLDEIKESLEILRSAEIHVTSLDGSFSWTPSYLSNMILANRADFEKGSKCFVLFDNLVSVAVKNLDFKEYNYAIVQRTKNSIAKYLIKRMDQRFKQASFEKHYTIKMSTIFKALYRELDQKMSNNTRLMNKAIDELKKHKRVTHVLAEPIKSDLDKRRIVDYSYTFVPSVHLIADTKRFLAKKRILNEKASIYIDEQFDKQL